MTATRTYTCNLCRDAIKHEENGYGIHYRSGGIDLVRLVDAETHLCTDCGSHLMTAFDLGDTAAISPDEQVKHMVNRFLAWKLPENFNPDGGISFKRTFNDHLPVPMKHEPSGTNLLDATQATAMVRHMIEGIPIISATSSSGGEHG